MERNDTTQEPTALTAEDLNEFLSATDDEQWNILVAHAERNEKIIRERKSKNE